MYLSSPCDRLVAGSGPDQPTSVSWLFALPSLTFSNSVSPGAYFLYHQQQPSLTSAETSVSISRARYDASSATRITKPERIRLTSAAMKRSTKFCITCLRCQPAAVTLKVQSNRRAHYSVSFSTRNMPKASNKPRTNSRNRTSVTVSMGEPPCLRFLMNDRSNASVGYCPWAASRTSTAVEPKTMNASTINSSQCGMTCLP